VLKKYLEGFDIDYKEQGKAFGIKKVPKNLPYKINGFKFEKGGSLKRPNNEVDLKELMKDFSYNDISYEQLPIVV